MILTSKEYSEILDSLYPSESFDVQALINHDTALRLAATKLARDLIELAELVGGGFTVDANGQVKRAKALLKKLGEVK